MYLSSPSYLDCCLFKGVGYVVDSLFLMCMQQLVSFLVFLINLLKKRVLIALLLMCICYPVAVCDLWCSELICFFVCLI